MLSTLILVIVVQGLSFIVTTPKSNVHLVIHIIGYVVIDIFIFLIWLKGWLKGRGK